ncbi:MAG: L,D-transpeptidase [Solirubrobacteraceae bacterium]
MPRRAKRSSETGAPRRSQNVRRLQAQVLCLIIVLCACSGVTAASAAAASAPGHIGTSQRLAEITYAHQAYRHPRTTAREVAAVPPRTPITGERTTLPIIAQANGTGATRWLKVMLPGRPNGLSGWIKQGGTSERVTPWHITVSLSARRLRVYLDGQLQRSFSTVVGKPSSPTPTGNFFVQETVNLGAKLAGGPFALALSARSNVFSEFDGGPGQIAIHGRDLLGGTLGQAQSHGCMRLATPAIDWLAARIGPGVPVTIY